MLNLRTNIDIREGMLRKAYYNYKHNITFHLSFYINTVPLSKEIQSHFCFIFLIEQFEITNRFLFKFSDIVMSRDPSIKKSLCSLLKKYNLLLNVYHKDLKATITMILYDFKSNCNVGLTLMVNSDGLSITDIAMICGK